MSIQWTLIAGFLYFEIAIVSLMIFPIFSPRRWSNFFHSRFLSAIRERAAVYFYMLLGILVLFLLDAVREMRKYASFNEPRQLSSEMKSNVKLFRSQRNFYITGFAIFLAFVIRRLAHMIIIQNELEIKALQIVKKADETAQLAKKAVLAEKLQNDAEKLTEHRDLIDVVRINKNLIKEQKDRIKELEQEVFLWKKKCEEVAK